MQIYMFINWNSMLKMLIWLIIHFAQSYLYFYKQNRNKIGLHKIIQTLLKAFEWIVQKYQIIGIGLKIRKLYFEPWSSIAIKLSLGSWHFTPNAPAFVSLDSEFHAWVQ